MTGQVAFLLAAAVALCAVALSMASMAAVACRDMRSFEIDPDPLLAATLAALAAVAAAEGLHGLPDSLLAASVGWAAVRVVARLLPGRIGQGDVWLFAAMGAIAGTGLLPLLLALFAVFAVAAAAAYSWMRGRRMFRSMVPAALPGMAAAAIVLALRVGEPLVRGVPRDAGTALAGPNAVSVLLLLTAWTVAARAGLVSHRGARR